MDRICGIEGIYYGSLKDQILSTPGWLVGLELVYASRADMSYSQ